MITPGPVVITVAFNGYLFGGHGGGAHRRSSPRRDGRAGTYLLRTLMLTLTLIARTLAASPRMAGPVCSLAGPPVDVRWSGAVPLAPTGDVPLRLVSDIALPGSASRFAYQSLEPGSGRSFISHMGAGQLVVFDVRAGRVVGNLDGSPTVTGVLAVPAEHRVYASAPGDH